MGKQVKKKTTGKKRREANLKNGKATQFTKKRQPSPKKKKAGWLKKKALTDLLELGVKGKDEGSSQIRKVIASYLGCKESDISKDLTLEVAMHLRQIDKAIKKGDTQAYIAVLDRAHGKPISNIELSGKDGEELNININRKEVGESGK